MFVLFVTVALGRWWANQIRSLSIALYGTLKLGDADFELELMILNATKWLSADCDQAHSSLCFSPPHSHS